jgi:hypothetical protein
MVYSVLLGVHQGMDNKMAKLTHEIVIITPEMAKEWLDKSKFDNRNISRTNLNRIKKDIENGMWVFDGNPIRFNSEGDVIDGQHRLQAVIQTGKPIRSMVIVGIADRAKLTIDTGNTRKTSDILHFSGVKNSVPMSVAARLLVGYNETNGDMVLYLKSHSIRGISAQSINDCIEDNPGLLDSVTFATSKLNAKKILGCGCLGFLHYILSIEPRYGYLADEFFERFDSGVGLEDGSPIAAARNAISMGLNYKGGREYLVAKCAIIIKAWNLYTKDKQAKYIRYSKSEQFPKIAA